MYKKISLWTLTGLLCFFQNEAQAQDSLKTQLLETILVESSPLEKYLSGTKMTQLDSQILRQSDGDALSTILMRHSPVYLKEYGSGMLASISFRGTGSNHTAVLWNGMNLNSLTAGGLDYGILPIFMFESIDIQHGSASSLYGSDALGGAIYLNSNQNYSNKFRLNLIQNIGSFGTFFTGLKTAYGSKKLAGKTKIYHSISENNFPFKNTAKIGFPTENQTHAQIQNYGISQAINYQFNSKNIFSSELWFHASDRNLAHSMARVGEKTGEIQKDESLRFSAQFTHHQKTGCFHLKSGFISDKLNYNNLSKINTNRLIFSGEYETELTKKITLRTGVNHRKITADVDAYGSKITENRTDIFALFRYEIADFWTLSLNTRQAFVTDFSAPFSPSFGSNFKIWNHEKHRLIFKVLASRNYRVPTLNDRYWQEGGNPDILPENGLSAEAGLAYFFKRKNFKLNAEITHFRMNVKNWILWRPTGQFWSPMNLRKVQSNGLETSLHLSGNSNLLFWQVGGNYALTKSINKKKLHEYDNSVNKQLIYTPLHRATAFGKVSVKTWNFGTNFQFTGKRFTLSDNSEFLEGFELWDINLGKKLRLKKHSFSANFQVKNLLNKQYQNLQNYAMPERHFMLNLKYQF